MMICPNFNLPKAHYTVEFHGSDFERGSAIAWCDHQLHDAIFVEVEDGEIIFHFQTSRDAVVFHNRFHSLCSYPRSSSATFLLYRQIGNKMLN